MAFLLIGSNPVRFRPLMLVAMLEKFSYVTMTTVMYLQSRISSLDAQAAIPDSILGMLFVAAFVVTRSPAATRDRDLARHSA